MSEHKHPPIWAILTANGWHTTSDENEARAAVANGLTVAAHEAKDEFWQLGTTSGNYLSESDARERDRNGSTEPNGT